MGSKLRVTVGIVGILLLVFCVAYWRLSGPALPDMTLQAMFGVGMLGSTLVVDDPRRGRNRHVVLVAIGTKGAKAALRTVRSLAALGAADEILAVVVLDWNEETLRMRRHVPTGIRWIAPTETLPGLPNGFLNNSEMARQNRHLWGPLVEQFIKEAVREHATLDLVAGLAVFLLSPGGGHIPVTEDAVRWLGKLAPEIYQVGIYAVPSSDFGLIPNLKRDPGYPDDLLKSTPRDQTKEATPAPGLDALVLMNNRDLLLADAVEETLLVVGLTGPRYLEKGVHQVAEPFSRIAQVSPIMAVGHASGEVPIIRPDLWMQINKWVFGRQPGVNAKQVPSILADIGINAIRPTAKMLPSADPPFKAAQALFEGGMPFKQGSRTVNVEDRRRAKQQVEQMVRVRMTQLGLTHPDGLEYVWSSYGEGSSHNYQRVRAVWVYPIFQTARSFVDELIRQYDEDLQGHPGANAGNPTSGASNLSGSNSDHPGVRFSSR